jgi:hypothetical protein
MMSTEHRILDGDALDGAGALEQELVSCLRPSEAERAVVWQRLTAQAGLVAGASAVIGAATAKAVTSAGGVAAGTGAGAAAASSSAVGSALTAFGSLGLLPKFGLVLVLAAPAAIGVHAYNDDPEPPTVRAPVAAPQASPTKSETAPEVKAPEAELESPSQVETQSATASPKPPTGAKRQLPAVDSHLAEENELLRKARNQMQSGNPNGALATLSKMDQSLPGGALRQERALLRIQALSARGSSAEARERAENFLKTYPQSPYALHLRRTVLGSKSSKSSH